SDSEGRRRSGATIINPRDSSTPAAARQGARRQPRAKCRNRRGWRRVLMIVRGDCRNSSVIGHVVSREFRPAMPAAIRQERCEHRIIPRPTIDRAPTPLYTARLCRSRLNVAGSLAAMRPENYFGTGFLIQPFTAIRRVEALIARIVIFMIRRRQSLGSNAAVPNAAPRSKG